MPLYEYSCRSGHLIERLSKYERRLQLIRCKCCQPAALVVSMPAKTAWSWGDSKWEGFNDRGTNVTYRDKRHREQVMKERGLRELREGEVEAEQRRVMREHEQHETNMATFQRVLKDTGSSSKAMAETFPNPEV